MPDQTVPTGQSGGVNVKRARVGARDITGRDRIEVGGNLYIVQSREELLAGLQGEKPMSPFQRLQHEQEQKQFADGVAREFRGVEVQLGSWPMSGAKGEDLIPILAGLLQRVEGNAEYCQANNAAWAGLYRFLGGAYMLHSGMEMAEKLRTALPYLRQSHVLWAEQVGLRENIAFFEAMLIKGQSDIKEFITNTLQILRGPHDAQIPIIAEALANSMKTPSA